jgi:Uma2 family endonuclease
MDTTFDHEEADRWLDDYFAKTPENKLELIDGQLIISTLKGSRRIAWELLKDYGPFWILPYAADDLWWSALQLAFNPQPLPRSQEEWLNWAKRFVYDPEPAGAGQLATGVHRHFYELLQHAFYYFGGTSGLGQTLGRDFVIRLGNNGVTPDCIFIDQTRSFYLHHYYLDGVPAIAIEITQEGSEEQDRILKRRLYEQAGVPEYWLIEPDQEQITFHLFNAEQFCYTELAISQKQLTSSTELARFDPIIDSQAIYHSPFIPGLGLSLHDFWSMQTTDWKQRWLPLLPYEGKKQEPPAKLPRDENDELSWGSLPYQPRLDLHPVAIRFEEFISWCPEAKFEGFGKGMVIGGYESTAQVLGMLAMSLGLIDLVTLAHPCDWVTCLCRDRFAPQLQTQVDELMRQATYKRLDHIKEETYHGEIPESKIVLMKIQSKPRPKCCTRRLKTGYCYN